MSVFQLHEDAVEVHRMRHHGVVHDGEPNALSMIERNRVGRIGILDAVDRPHVPLHVARQMEFDLSRRRLEIQRRRKPLDVRPDEHTPAIFAKARTGLREAALRFHRRHGVRRAVLVGAVHDRLRYGARRPQVCRPNDRPVAQLSLEHASPSR